MILPLRQACGLPAPLSGEPCVRYLASPEKRRETAIGGGEVLLLRQACGLPAPLSGEPCVDILPPLKKGGEPPSAVEGFYPSVKPAACQLPFLGSHASRYLAFPEKGRGTASGGGGVLLLSQAYGLSAPLSGEPCVRYLASPEKGRETASGGGGVIHLKL